MALPGRARMRTHVGVGEGLSRDRGSCVRGRRRELRAAQFEQDSVTQEMLIYIAFRTNERFEAEQDIYEFTLSQPELFRLPAAR